MIAERDRPVRGADSGESPRSRTTQGLHRRATAAPSTGGSIGSLSERVRRQPGAETCRRSADRGSPDRGRRVSGVSPDRRRRRHLEPVRRCSARILRAIDAQTRRGRTRSSWSTTPPPTTPRRCWTGWPPSWPRRSTSLRLDRNTGGAGGFHAGLERGAGRRTPTSSGSWTTTASRRRTASRRLLAHVDALRLPRPRGRRRGRPAAALLPDPRPRHRPRRARPRRRRARARSTGCSRTSSSRSTACWSPADLVERIGLPREEFFIWGDDVEYLWRARRAGARVATVVGQPLPAPGHRRPRHADDVRPHDVQPLAVGPQALLHGPQQRHEPAGVRRRARRAGLPGQDRCGSTRSPGRSAAGSGSAPQACRAACAATSPATRGSS